MTRDLGTRSEKSDGYAALVDELHTTLGRLGLVLALARDALAWIDGRGRIVWCNPAFDALVGRDHLDLLGVPLSSTLQLSRDGVEVTGDAHPASRVLAHPRGDVDERYDAVAGGGSLVVEVVGRRGVIDHEPAAVLVIRDITERARASRALEALNAQLEAANDELEAFSYSVSHDLRAPLRAIDGFGLALLEDYGSRLDASGKDYLRRLRAATESMARLIDDLLRLSRVTRAELWWADVDLSAMCREIAADLAASAPERRVDFAIADGMTLRGDPRLLRQAMRNLLENAWKFTGKAPSARIEVAAQAGREHGTDPVYFVRDDGAGFDMRRADKLFGAFQRLHAASDFPGSGIGLAIVRRIFHRHGGRVWAEAAVGEGATFYFTIPTDRIGAP